MHEAKVKFVKAKDEYRVYTDAHSDKAGDLKFVGTVEKNFRPMTPTSRWMSRKMGGDVIGFGSTRSDAASKLF